MKESFCSQRGSVNSFLLSALEGGDKYAYEIGKAVKEISGGKYVLKEASLYSGLKRLEAQGFLTSYKAELENGLSRRYYKLTESGKEKLASMDFSWDSEQKGSIIKAFNENDLGSATLEEEKNVLKNEIIAEPADITNTDIDEEKEFKNSAITVSDEKENLTKHYIHENQQDLFSIINNNLTDHTTKKNENDDKNSTTSDVNENELTNKKIDDTLENSYKAVNDFEFYNLKNNLKYKSESFIDKVNNEHSKPFIEKYSSSNSSGNNIKQVQNFAQKEASIDLLKDELNDTPTFKLNESINNNEPIKNNENIEVPSQNIQTQTSDHLSKIDINDIFGDLYIKNEPDDNTETNLKNSDENDKQTVVNSAVLDKTEIITNKNNINCTLELPKIKEETINSSDNSDLLFNTKSAEEIIEKKEEKNLNELFEVKETIKKPSITMNNSVLYANQKINHEKPSFETMFQNKIDKTFEVRFYKPVELKNVKSTFINLNKIKMFSSLGAFLLQVIFTLIIFFIFDKAPLSSFSKVQTLCYVVCITVPFAICILNIILYFTNRYKMVNCLDFKTNISFKLLFGLCIISALFIVYKFFELNITLNYSYLILLPISVFVSLIIEELFKFCLCKIIKN